MHAKCKKLCNELCKNDALRTAKIVIYCVYCLCNRPHALLSGDFILFYFVLFYFIFIFRNIWNFGSRREASDNIPSNVHIHCIRSYKGIAGVYIVPYTFPSKRFFNFYFRGVYCLNYWYFCPPPPFPKWYLIYKYSENFLFSPFFQHFTPYIRVFLNKSSYIFPPTIQ